MPNELASFLVSIGFKVDATGQAKAVGAVKKTEAGITKATLDELEKRRRAEDAALAERINEAVKAGKQLTAEEKSAAERITKNQVAEEDKRAKLKAERDKRVKDAWTRTQKDRVDALVGVRNAAIKATVAVAAADAGLVALVDRAAKGFERLSYLSARSGSSATNVSAFGYASGQLGSSNEAGNASLSEFGGKLRKYPGYAEALRGLGIKTRGANGEQRDTADLATDLGDALSRIAQTGGASGYANAIARARMFGFDEDQARAMMNPEFRAREGQFRADQAKVGANPNAAAASGTDFEKSLRHLQEVVEAVGTAIQDKLQVVLKPQLDALAKWVQDHGKDLTTIATTFVDGVTKLVSSLVQSDGFQEALTKVNEGLHTFADYIKSDTFKKDVKTFTDDIAGLARAVHWALQKFGFISGDGDAQPGGGSASAPLDHGDAPSIRYGRQHAWGDRHPVDLPATGDGAVKMVQRPQRGAWWTPDRQAHAVDRLMKEAGLSQAGAEGLVSRWANVEAASGPTAQNPNSGAVGIGQWLGSRKKGFTADFDSQLDHAVRELNGSENRAANALRSAQNSREGAIGASMFERAEGYDGRTGIDHWTGKSMAGAPRVHDEVDLALHPRGSGEDGNALHRNDETTFPRARGPKSSIFGALGAVDPGQASRPAGPLGVPPSMLHLNTSTKGDTHVTHNPTFNIKGPDLAASMSAARLTASRGTQDLLRNVQGSEQ